MNDKPRSNDFGFLLVVIALVVLGFIIMNIVAMIVALVVILLVAAAVYFGSTTGYKLAMDSEVWENRRVAKFQNLQVAREREKAYFASQGQDWMNVVVDNHYDDAHRDLYKKKDSLQEVGKTMKKVKDLFR